jgi:uncharacterized membrane protein YdbT with pleckstrin-like domain
LGRVREDPPACLRDLEKERNHKKNKKRKEGKAEKNENKNKNKRKKKEKENENEAEQEEGQEEEGADNILILAVSAWNSLMSAPAGKVRPSPMITSAFTAESSSARYSFDMVRYHTGGFGRSEERMENSS